MVISGKTAWVAWRHQSYTVPCNGRLKDQYAQCGTNYERRILQPSLDSEVITLKRPRRGGLSSGSIWCQQDWYVNAHLHARIQDIPRLVLRLVINNLRNTSQSESGRTLANHELT